MRQQFLDDSQVRHLIESSIEGENRPRAFQTVAGEIQLFHSVQVLSVQFHGGPVRRFGQPHVQVAGFAGFEEEDVVAVVQVGELVELVELGLGVELRIFAAVREERVEVGEEMAVSVYRGWLVID